MAREVDVQPVRVSPSGPREARTRQRGVLGCLAGGIGAPVLGAVLFGLTGRWELAALGAFLAFLGTLVWVARQVMAGSSRAAPMTWSFTPLGAATIAATDVLATVGDAFGPATWVLLAVPCAMLGGGVVFLSELQESRRPLYSLAKAVIATMLIAVPLPVGGLVGAGASLGHRMLVRPEHPSRP